MNYCGYAAAKISPLTITALPTIKNQKSAGFSVLLKRPKKTVLKAPRLSALTIGHISTIDSKKKIDHNGKLSCFFHGFSSLFPRSFLSPSAIRRRVECG